MDFNELHENLDLRNVVVEFTGRCCRTKLEFDFSKFEKYNEPYMIHNSENKKKLVGFM